MAHQSSLFRSNDSTRTSFGPSYGSAHMQNMNGRFEEQVRGPAVNQNHGPGYHGQQSQAVRTMNNNAGNSSRFHPGNNVPTGSKMGTNPTRFKPGPALAQGWVANENFINTNPSGHINYQQPGPSGNLYSPNFTHSVQGQMIPSGPNLQNLRPVGHGKQPSQLERCMTKAKELRFGLNEDVVHLGELFREKENQEIFLSFTGTCQVSWLKRGIADQMKKNAVKNKAAYK